MPSFSKPLTNPVWTMLSLQICLKSDCNESNISTCITLVVWVSVEPRGGFYARWCSGPVWILPAQRFFPLCFGELLSPSQLSMVLVRLFLEAVTLGMGVKTSLLGMWALSTETVAGRGWHSPVEGPGLAFYSCLHSWSLELLSPAVLSTHVLPADKSLQLVSVSVS